MDTLLTVYPEYDANALQQERYKSQELIKNSESENISAEKCFTSKMKRKDKEITNVQDKLNIIKKCKVCRIGLSENNKPYIIPLNYGYDFENNTLTLYFHSTIEGKKMNIIKNNNNACFEVDCDNQLLEAKKACNYSYAFKSIVGFGKIIFLEDTNEKIAGLNKIMQHQTGKEDVFIFSPEEMKNVVVYKMAVEEFTGKQKKIEK